MARHFGPQHMHNGYAAMGSNSRRPIYSGVSERSVADSIAAERRKAARMANAAKSKK